MRYAGPPFFFAGAPSSMVPNLSPRAVSIQSRRCPRGPRLCCHLRESIRHVCVEAAKRRCKSSCSKCGRVFSFPECSLVIIIRYVRSPSRSCAPAPVRGRGWLSFGSTRSGSDSTGMVESAPVRRRPHPPYQCAIESRGH